MSLYKTVSDNPAVKQEPIVESPLRHQPMPSSSKPGAKSAGPTIDALAQQEPMSIELQAANTSHTQDGMSIPRYQVQKYFANFLRGQDDLALRAMKVIMVFMINTIVPIVLITVFEFFVLVYTVAVSMKRLGGVFRRRETGEKSEGGKDRSKREVMQFSKKY